MKKKTLSLMFLLIGMGTFSQTEITITTPNGGEIYVPEETISIEYTLINAEAGDDLSFRYSIDNGLTYNWIGSTYFSSTPIPVFNGTYSWTIPFGINSENCLINTEVYRTPGGVGVVSRDTSNNVFTIQEPASEIIFISPIGGEVFIAGDNVDINYTCLLGETGDVLDFYYSINDGVDYTFIDNNEFMVAPASPYYGSISWIVPSGINSSSCLLKAELTRVTVIIDSDTTDSNFSINETSGISEFESNQIKFYPNPSNDEINIDLTGLEDVQILVYNLAGQCVFKDLNVNSDQYKLNLKSGTYILEVNSKTKNVNQKVVKL